MNHLYYGDNLEVMRKHIADESVDLVYLDPPFNSNADYNAMFKTPKGGQSPAQMTAFTDTWQWDDAISGQAVSDVKKSQFQDAAKMLDAMIGFLGKNALTAYLAMMAVRLVELHRVLKPAGSLYLHCDPTASHYLKILLDAVFGAKNFRNEIIWKRTSAHSDATQKMASIHDIILAYSKGSSTTFNLVYRPYTNDYIEEHFVHLEPDGRRFRRSDLVSPSPRPNLTYDFVASNGITYKPHANGWKVSKDVMQKLDDEGRLFFPKKEDARLRKKLYLNESPGVPVGDLWDDIPPIHASAQERLGYPTQKPVALLERILAASSDEGDTVLDPFCGCGTTVVAAEKMKRKWIGIDITHLAIGLIEVQRLSAFPQCEYKVHGTPMDVDAARDFFDRDDKTKKEFEKWAVTRLHFVPQEKKGKDGGIDGVKWFGVDEEFKAVVSVKGGKNVGVEMVRSIDAVTTEQGAQVGVLLVLEPPTKDMIAWAKKSGLCEVAGLAPVPRIQIVTIAEAMEKRDHAVNLPTRNVTLKRAALEEDTTRQKALDL